MALSRRFARLACLLLVSALLPLLAAPARAQSQADIDKVVSLMHADNYDFRTTTSNSVWTIHFTGDHLKDIKVVIAVGGDPSMLVIFVTVSEKRTLPVTTDFMSSLLKKNHEFDRVKIGYDADGDLFVRDDAMLRVTDAEEFHSIISQVEKSSDELYGDIQSQLLN